MRLEVLGEMRALVDGVVVDVTADKERLVLAALGLGGESGVTVTTLLEDLWGGDVANKASLQTYVSNLRRRLRPNASDALVIELAGESYRLNADVVATDVSIFRHHLGEARAILATGDRPERALDPITRALAVASGPVDPSLVDETSSMTSEASRLREEWLEAKWIWADLEIDAGNAARVIPDLQRIVEDHPTEERFWHLLMLALWRTGRQDDALGAYQAVRQVLSEDLGVLPNPSLQDLELAILRHDPMLGAPAAGVASSERRASRLPISHNSFVGRSSELIRIEELLQRHHLLTLKGAGGCGKTRLACELAVRQSEVFAGGVHLVELGELDDEAEGEAAVVDAIATAIGMIRRSQGSLQETLFNTLSAAPALLVLDNCEKMIDPIAEVVTRLVAHCADLKVLATSRESLRVVGEVIVAVDPLTVADGELGDSPTDSAQLFFDRADPTGDHLGDDAETQTTVEAICLRLDGVPLAIELAAALAATVPLAEILDELGADRFGLLSVEMRGTARHHRTLDAVVRWSYDRLSDDEQRAFAAVSMCPGTFSPSAAAALCQLSPSVTKQRLDALVRQSMIETVRTVHGVERYRLLETMRVFGLRCVEENGDGDELEQRFIEYFAELAQRESYDPQTSITEWFDELLPDIPNLRMAIRRAMETNAYDPALVLIDSFHWYYNHVGSLNQAEQWLRSLVPGFDPPLEVPDDIAAMLENSVVSPAHAVMAFTSLASLANLGGRYSETSHWSDLAVASAREHGDSQRRLAALVMRGATAVYENRLDVAFESLAESRTISGELGDRWGVAVALMFVALGERRQVDELRRADPTSDWMTRLANIRVRFERAYELFDQLRDDRGMALVLVNLGRIEQHKGDLEAAEVLTERGLHRAEAVGDDVVCGLAHVFRGRVAAEAGEYPFAVDCFVNTLNYCNTPDRHRVLFSNASEWLGVIASRHGDCEPLLRIAAATELYRDAPRTATALPELHDETARARREVGPERSAELEQDGRSMQPDAVRQLAIRAARAAVSQGES